MKFNNLRDLLGNPKDKVKRDKSEVIKYQKYKIQCVSCAKCYVGQTKRSIGEFRDLKNIYSHINKTLKQLNYSKT